MLVKFISESQNESCLLATCEELQLVTRTRPDFACDERLKCQAHEAHSCDCNQLTSNNSHASVNFELSSTVSIRTYVLLYKGF